jgi:DNA-directed RNA polymerase specialized sigma24 family protein
MDDKVLKELVIAMKAVVLMQVQLLAEAAKREKPEIVLARAGFTPKEIAKMLNKNADAVAKAVQRGKAA